MEKTSKFKLLKLSSFFTSSCKTQNLDEVIDHGKNPIFTPQKPIFLQTPFIEKALDNEEIEEKENYPFGNFVIKPNNNNNKVNYYSSSSSLMCKPRCPKTFDQMIRENCIITATENTLQRRKVAGRYELLSPSGDYSGRKCPPASPASPLFLKQGNNKKKNKHKKTRKINNTHFGKNNNFGVKNGKKMSNPFNFSSSNETDYNNDLFSSDDEREDDEKQTVFSLKSMSFSSKSISFSSDSDTGEYNTKTQGQTQTQGRARTRTRTRPRRQKTGSGPKEVGAMPLEVKVKDTFAIVKSSSDPYNDFRTSMVEMIIEKQIFGAKELEQLLKCFLCLNSSHHHRVIVQVFSEICDALFSHCS